MSGRGKEGVVTIFSILLNEELRVKFMNALEWSIVKYMYDIHRHVFVLAWYLSSCLILFTPKYVFTMAIYFVFNIGFFLILKVILPYMVSISICFVYLQAFCDFPPLFASLKEKHHKKACYTF